MFGATFNLATLIFGILNDDILFHIGIKALSKNGEPLFCQIVQNFVRLEP